MGIQITAALPGTPSENRHFGPESCHPGAAPGSSSNRSHLSNSLNYQLILEGPQGFPRVGTLPASSAGQGGRDSMSAAVPLRAVAAPEPHPCTLLELVRVLSEITDNEHEVIATAI